MMTVPQENPKVSAKLKKHVEKVQNLVTTQEMEYKRLKGLCGGERAKIDALLKEKVALNESIESLKKAAADAQKLVDTVHTSLTSKQEELSDLHTDEIRIKAEREALTGEKEDWVTLHTDQVKELEDAKADLASQLKAVGEREAFLKDKAKALKEILSDV